MAKYTYDINSSASRISLDDHASSWLDITSLTDDMLQYTTNNFDTMFSYHPESRAKVIMFNDEVPCNRWQLSYLNTPKYDPTQNSSYMFADKNNEVQSVLPVEFQKILDYVNLSKNAQYNQVTVNWYNANTDYIAYHSDYTIGLDTDITVVNLVKNEEMLRNFCVKPKSSNKIALYSRVYVPLYNGLIITMAGNTQKEYTHGVPKLLVNSSNSKKVQFAYAGPRISLSFRSYSY